MNTKSEVRNSNKRNILNILSGLFGVVVFAVGIVNTFWGNDPGFGVFLTVLSCAYFPPLTAILEEKTGLSVPGFLKFGLGIFIIWAVLGVGELFDKIDLMMMDL